MSIHRLNPDPTAEIRIGPKTYAETKGAPPFDWNAFLRRAESSGIRYYDSQHQEAINMAGSWVTCACGNQCDVIPRWNQNDDPILGEYAGKPKDEELAILGMDFYRDITRMSWGAAKEVLAAIERRSAELIVQLTACPCTQPS